MLLTPHFTADLTQTAVKLQHCVMLLNAQSHQYAKLFFSKITSSPLGTVTIVTISNRDPDIQAGWIAQLPCSICLSLHLEYTSIL